MKFLQKCCSASEFRTSFYGSFGSVVTATCIHFPLSTCFLNVRKYHKDFGNKPFSVICASHTLFSNFPHTTNSPDNWWLCPCDFSMIQKIICSIPQESPQELDYYCLVFAEISTVLISALSMSVWKRAARLRDPREKWERGSPPCDGLLRKWACVFYQFHFRRKRTNVLCTACYSCFLKCTVNNPLNPLFGKSGSRS